MPDAGGAARFWTLAEPLLARPDVERGTMMGFPCLRRGGQFFAMVDHAGTAMIAKLPAPRVLACIDGGIGRPFAPAGKVFREWVEVPLEQSGHWADLLDEAHDFVG